MDKRNFIKGLLTIGAGFMILPPAATARIWSAKVMFPVNESPFLMTDFTGTMTFVDLPPRFDPRILDDIRPGLLANMKAATDSVDAIFKMSGCLTERSPR